MALRVKKLMPGELLEMIRLLLMKHAAQLQAQKQQLSVCGERSARQQSNNQVSELDLSFPIEIYGKQPARVRDTLTC